MPNLFLLDAMGYLFRSYYAIQPMTNGKGESTNALFGFIRSIQKVIDDFAPTHLVAVFDGPDNKRRRQALYPNYKGDRKKAPEDLYQQIGKAHLYCELAGIPLLAIEGVEADDTIASIVHWGKKKGYQATICSSDKDLMQLIDSDVKMVNVHKENMLFDAKEVENLYGVPPSKMVDLLAIMGDASDSVPGLPGFGQKGAAALLQEFGSLDALLAHPEKVKGEKKQEILRTHREEALLSRSLIALHTDVDVPHSLAFYEKTGGNSEALSLFFHEMNFLSFLKKGDKKEGKKGHYALIDTEEALDAFLKSAPDEMAFDTETTSLTPMEASLVGVGFSIEEGKAVYIPCNGHLGKKRVLEALTRLFGLKKVAVTGHNLKYDIHVLMNEGVPLPRLAFDTLLASYLVHPEKRTHNLDDLALTYFGKVKIGIEELLGKGKTAITMDQVEIGQVQEYCGEDVDYTARLQKELAKELKEHHLEKLFFEIEMPLLPILQKMERRGIFLDQKELSHAGKLFGSRKKQLEEEIFLLSGSPFNLNSPKQLSEVLFEKLNLPKPKKGVSAFATSADVLEDLVSLHPIAEKILAFRTLDKLETTYVTGLLEAVDQTTGRIHCTFNQSGTATGRLSCQNPNLQNIPVRSEEGKKIRAAFRPEKSHFSFLGADYSQIELRLLAHFSQDKTLLKAFREGRDIHLETASLLFGVPESKVTPLMRGQAKTVNFGILYGQGPFGLARELKISQKEASHFIATYLHQYPGVTAYLEEAKEKVRKTGFATTSTGRRRPIPDILSKNPSLRAAAERLAVNTPLQGSAADLIKLAMIEIDTALSHKKLKSEMLLQIHDELIFEAPDAEIEELSHLVKRKMEGVFSLDVPLTVNTAVGKNWSEC